jgi:hypothetical protein
LGEIAAIRDLQRTAAEAEASRAARVVEEKNARLDECERQRAFAEENWRRALAAPSIPLGILGLWSADLLRRDEDAGRAASDVGVASREFERCSANWYAAVRRRDVADSMVRKVLKDKADRRDEKQLQDVLDGSAQREHEL